MAYISFQPNDYFNTKLYTGNGSTNAITGVGFQPDMCWWKMRSGTEEHALGDAVRGAGYIVKPNSSDAQAQSASYFASFNSDGFTLGSDDKTNKNTSTYASWNWKANGAGSSNTDGSITSTVSANTTSGFSIVKYTNPSSGSPFTVGHGLGSPPKMIMVKNITGSAQNWGVWHTGIGFGKYLQLNTTISQATANLVTATSNTTFSTYHDHHTSGVDLIAYCFAEKKGFSKFGSYVGNGNANGGFLYCGFKPAFLLLKNSSDGAKNWEMLDNKRPSTGQNPADDILFPDTSDAESASQTDRLVDFVSNGVKIRGNSAQMNGNGNTHIFMAFAEEPLVASNGVPATAR